MNAVEDQLALARAALDPEAAMEARDRVDENAPPIEAPVGVLALERHHALTLAIEVDPPTEFNRWRYFVFYHLMKLAAWFYPFKFEIYRTRQPWE